MALSPQWLDELRARVTLSSVISRTTRLTKAGHEFKACCPFHNEKSPSFTVNDQKGFYHCFGCGAHGDVVGFVMNHDNMTFMDAIEHLAGLAGMQVPPNMGADYTAEFRRIFPDLAQEHGVALIPFVLEGIAGDARLNQADGIHPTAEGQAIMAETIWKHVQPLLTKQP